MEICIEDLEVMNSKEIPDLVIYNHRGEIKDTLTSLRGIPLPDILASFEIPADKPRELNEHYIILSASDNYKVVYSWNEVFNHSAGEKIYVITSEGGKKLNELPYRIMCVSTSDKITGSRYVKGLSPIIIEKAD